jgi:hypothetical protein
MYQDLLRMGFSDADSERISVAFDRLSLTITKWPTVVAVKEAVPRLAEMSFKRLPYKRTPEVRERGIEALEAIKKSLKPKH